MHFREWAAYYSLFRIDRLTGEGQESPLLAPGAAVDGPLVYPADPGFHAGRTAPEPLPDPGLLSLLDRIEERVT